MSEYTPTTDEVRAVWREWNGYGGLTYRTTPEPSRREMRQEFDDWLDRERAVARREGQAEALREAAATDDPDHDTEVALGGSDYVRVWLNARADRIEADQ